jgi:sugar/nucleoside kinase (ribokinase family)
MADPQRDVCGIGNAMVDVVSYTYESFLRDNNLVKGAMTLIDAQRADDLYSKTADCVECPGGSAANTMAGLASLGASGIYIGKVRDDSLGKVFQENIRASGVDFEVPPARSGPGTGRCMVFVTPDAERTMQTFLGASATLAPEDIDPDSVRSARIVYLEGYMWDPEPAKRAFLKAADIAHQAGRKVALSLSDSFCVDRHRSEFRELVDHHVDILFANEDEIVSLYHAADIEDALAEASRHCALLAITRGDKGSVVVSETRKIVIEAEPVAQVVDTTGAGDLYASGFLLGLSRGHEVAECGRLGSLAAAEIVSHFGARPQRLLQDLYGKCR